MLVISTSNGTGEYAESMIIFSVPDVVRIVPYFTFGCDKVKAPAPELDSPKLRLHWWTSKGKLMNSKGQ